MKSQHNYEVTVQVNGNTGAVLAAYFRVRRGNSAETKEFAGGKLVVDYDKKGQLLGIEVLAPCKRSDITKILTDEPEVKKFVRQSAPRELISA